MSQPENFLGVFGHVNLDYIMDVEKLPKPNTSVQVGNVRRYFGGTGANVSLMAASMGVRTALASFVGTDFPDDFKAALLKTGVDICDLMEMSGYMTPTCRIMNDPDNNQICVMDQGPMGAMDDFPLAEHTIIHSQIVHVGTGRPAYYRRVMEFAREKGKAIYFDPAQELRYLYTPKVFGELLDMADALFVNQHELKIAMRYLGVKTREKLLDRVDILVVTMGKDGSQITTPSGTVQIKAIKPRKVVDPTGAGDAYRAGFYAGLSRGMDLESCGLLGASASSFAIGVKGPVGKLPTWDEVAERAGLS